RRSSDLPLQHNGGPVYLLTHAPADNSPVIDAGDNDYLLANDERGPGFNRNIQRTAVQGDNDYTDVGAVESQNGGPPVVASVTVNDGSDQRSRVTSVTVVFNTVVQFVNGPPEAAFRLTRTGPDGTTGDVTVAVDVVSGPLWTVATLTFSGALTESGSLVDGNYNLTVLASHVTANSKNLDGNYDGVGG